MWCGLNCSTACGIFIPRPGIKPISPGLQGRFLTSGPPGKSLTLSFFFFFGLIPSLIKLTIKQTNICYFKHTSILFKIKYHLEQGFIKLYSFDDYISKSFPGDPSDKEPACQRRIHKRRRDASQVHEKDIPGQQAGRRSLERSYNRRFLK